MQPDVSIPTPPPASKPSRSRDGWKNILFTVLILVGAPLLALFLTMFVFQSYRVDGISMETSLQNNDRLIIWKLPRTLARIEHKAYIPHRGDIIVFVKHDLPDSNGNAKQLIKRVIGLPGDRVVVKDNHITVYNNEHPDGFNPDTGHNFSPHIAAITPGEGAEWTIGPDQVFVCGDNRPDSLDSRYFGPISSSDIVGKLTYRIAPVGKFEHF